MNKLSNLIQNNFPSEGGFIWLLLECFIARKKNVSYGNAIADELRNIQFSLTTIRDASLPGILFKTHFLITDYREAVIDLHRKVRFKANLAYIRHGLSVGQREFTEKTKSFKANLAYCRQRFRLRD